MSDTPRTDAEAGYYDDSGCWHHRTNGENVDADFARQLERELAAAKGEIERMRADAERYRYLFSCEDFCRDPLWPVVAWMRDGTETRKDVVDAAIDAARAALKEPK